MCFAPQRRALFRHRNFQKCSENGVLCTFWLRNVLRATTARTFSTSERPKVLCTRQFFCTFDLEICFAPQRRALFRHLNFQKWSENGVFCTFWLRNVLRATTACTFSTSQLPKVLREWCALYILTSKCASRHNGVHSFDIATSKSGLALRCFVHFDFEMCFAPQRRAIIWPAGSAPAASASLLVDPPEPQIIGKTQCFATFLRFLASASSFFLLFLFYFLSSNLSLLSASSLLCFHLSMLSEVWLLNFLRLLVANEMIKGDFASWWDLSTVLTPSVGQTNVPPVSYPDLMIERWFQTGWRLVSTTMNLKFLSTPPASGHRTKVSSTASGSSYPVLKKRICFKFQRVRIATNLCSFIPQCDGCASSWQTFFD